MSYIYTIKRNYTDKLTYNNRHDITIAIQTWIDTLPRLASRFEAAVQVLSHGMTLLSTCGISHAHVGSPVSVRDPDLSFVRDGSDNPRAILFKVLFLV